MSHIRTVSIDIACDIEDIAITEKWIRYTDHLAEVERAVRTALDMSNDCIDAKVRCDQNMSCNECRVTRIMEELNK